MSRRLIDADALTDDILKSAVMIDDRGIQTGYEIAIELIKRQPTIDAVPLDGSFLKMSRGDYLIYKRHWLYEHFDQEIDIQRSAMKSMGYEPALKDTEPRWIPCSERLPEFDVKVLAYVKNKDPEGRFNKDGVYTAELKDKVPVHDPEGKKNIWGIPGYDSEWTVWAWSYFTEPNVLAWMPLPDPYEGEE